MMALGDDLSGQSNALTVLGAAKVHLAQAPGLDQALPERWAPSYGRLEDRLGSDHYPLLGWVTLHQADAAVAPPEG